MAEKTYLTTGQIARMFRMTRHQVNYVIRSKNLLADRHAGPYRLFGASKIDRIRDALPTGSDFRNADIEGFAIKEARRESIRASLDLSDALAAQGDQKGAIKQAMNAQRESTQFLVERMNRQINDQKTSTEQKTKLRDAVARLKSDWDL